MPLEARGVTLRDPEFFNTGTHILRVGVSKSCRETVSFESDTAVWSIQEVTTQLVSRLRRRMANRSVWGVRTRKSLKWMSSQSGMATMMRLKIPIAQTHYEDNCPGVEEISPDDLESSLGQHRKPLSRDDLLDVSGQIGQAY